MGADQRQLGLLAARRTSRPQRGVELVDALEARPPRALRDPRRVLVQRAEARHERLAVELDVPVQRERDELRTRRRRPARGR